MPAFLKNMFSGVIKAGALALARHAATGLGSGLLIWLLSHHVGTDLASRLVGDLQDALLTVTGIGLAAAGVSTSLKDVKNVNAKAAVTASAAYDAGLATQASTDSSKVQAVAAAMKAADAASPKDKAELVAALKNGTF